MEEVAVSITELGKPVEQVVLEIDYQIIDHFSRHLYGSANKAIEELVANGFDAYAERVFVYLPGQFTSEYVAVWDDGWSMGVGGLKDLWVIASSPKEDLGREAVGPRGTRKMIGKFGIGKLASYTIGNTITHLCRTKDDFLAVSVDYRHIHPADGGEPVTKSNPLSTPIRRLTEAEARTFVEGVFDTDRAVNAWDLFDAPSWTLAVVGALKGKELQQGRLMWVLGNGMPLRPDFKVWVNDEEVGPRLETNAFEELGFDKPGVREALTQDWRKAIAEGKVEGSLEFGREVGLDPRQPDSEIPYAYFPNLGWVWGTTRLFDKSLLGGRSSEHGRSHGFFVMVRGRLLNIDNAELFLKPPSYGTFYRAQFILNVDGLDDELLADRSRLQQDTAKAAELAILQQAVYSAARVALDARDLEKAEEEKHVATLPTRSREYYREPLTALLVKAGSEAPMNFQLSKPRVERQLLGEERPIAQLSSTGSGFIVNASHPYYKTLEARLGKTKKAREFYRVYDLFAVSELLLQGHLYDLGFPAEKIDEIASWREGLFRELAKAYEGAPSELGVELVNASYLGGKSFEQALAAVLEAMGFIAERRGAPGKEDVFLLATIGPTTYSLVFEAKGSRSRLANDDAEVSGAASHRDKVGAEHAVIVAREFVGFEGLSGRDPAILEECRATGRVSIMTVEAINELAWVVGEFSYPLDLVKEVFTTIESPAEKMERIQRLKAPTRDFDYPRLLQMIWKEQQEEAKGDMVAYRRIWQSGWKNELTIEEFERKIIALETLAGGRLRLTKTGQNVYITQAPELIVDAIDAALRGRGSAYPIA